MAIVQNPIIGRASGSVGNVVFQTQYGKNTLRSKPIFVKPNDTPLRILWRSKMKAITTVVSRGFPIITSYAPKCLVDCPTSSYIIGSFLKYATRNSIEDPFTINMSDFVGGGRPFWCPLDYLLFKYADEQYKIDYNQTGSESYTIDNLSKFYTILLDEFFNVVLVTDQTKKHPSYNVLLIDDSFLGNNSAKYCLLTIQNVENSQGILPSNVYLPTYKADMNFFYLFLSK